VDTEYCFFACSGLLRLQQRQARPALVSWLSGGGYEDLLDLAALKLGATGREKLAKQEGQGRFASSTWGAGELWLPVRPVMAKLIVDEMIRKGASYGKQRSLFQCF
jgi:hypothetical protein